MPDFLKNLLLRSGSPARDEGPAILQPRLPSLFESTGNADELGAPAADSISIETRTTGESTPQPEAPGRMEKPGRAAAPSTVIAGETKRGPGPEPQAMHPHPGPSSHPVRPDSGPQPEGLGQSVAQPGAAVHTSRADAAEPSPSPVMQAGPKRLEHILQRKPAGPDASTAAAAPAGTRDGVRESASPPRPDPAPSPQPALRPKGVPKGRRTIESDGPRADRIIHPQVNSVLEKTVLRPAPTVLTTQPAPIRPTPASAAGIESRESGNVVRIHIGRIEVRAVAAPPAPAPARASASTPKLSLDEYLRKRDEGR